MARVATMGQDELYYRLNVATIRVPALVQRRGDILPLARHFVEMYRARVGLPDATITGDAEAALLEYPWPGNIRELENVIHHALIVCASGRIHAADLGFSEPMGRLTAGRAVPATLPPRPDPAATVATALRTLVESEPGATYELVERLLVEIAYEYCEQNQVRTARLLGISRNILRAQLKRLGCWRRELTRPPAHRRRTSTRPEPLPDPRLPPVPRGESRGLHRDRAGRESLPLKKAFQREPRACYA